MPDIDNKKHVLIVGRTASGKDTLAEYLRECYHMTFVKSYTTRPRRTRDEDTHVFIDQKQADALRPDAAAYTKIGDYEYFATKQQVIDTDGYVIDPRGVASLCKNMPDTQFIVAYIVADADERREHAQQRGNKQTELQAFTAREQAEDDEFSSFENKPLDEFPENIVSVITLINDFDEMSLAYNAMVVAQTLDEV